MTKWLHLNITAKWMSLLSGFVILQSLQLGVSVISMRRIEQQAALTGAIHDQRLQTIQLGELARKIPEENVETPEIQNVLGSSLVSYGKGLHDIQALLVRHYHDRPELIRLAKQSSVSWDEFLAPMLQRARRASSPAALDTALRGYQIVSVAQIERLNRMLQMLEQYDRGVARSLAWAQAVIVALSLFLVGAGMFLMRRLVTRPLRSFFEATRAMAAGAYDRRVEVYSNDEIGELARAFNRMTAAVEDKTGRLRAFNELALAVTSSLSLQEILGQIMTYGMPLTGARGICIAFFDESRKVLSNWVTRGLPDSYVHTISFPAGGLADEVMRSGDYIVSHDRPGSTYPLTPSARAEGIQSIVCLPLASEHLRLGVIYFYRGEQDEFSFEDIELIRTFSRLAAHAIQNARLHESTVDLAETDSLTGLYNRRKLEQRLREEIHRAQRSARPLALLLLDVDRFKRINDEHGHAAGDTVLQALAGVLRREVRDVDLAARTGGEEFMILLPETEGDRAQRVAERIRQALMSESIAVTGVGRLQVTASIGIACYPLNGVTPETLIANADRALYAAKQSGRNRTLLYSESLLH